MSLLTNIDPPPPHHTHTQRKSKSNLCRDDNLATIWSLLCVWLMLFSCYVNDSSNQNALATAEEGDYAGRPQSPAHAPENLSGDIASSIPEYNENKQENTLLSGGNQHSAVTSPNYSFGVIPPMLASFGNAESQAREVSRLSSFVVSIHFHHSFL